METNEINKLSLPISIVIAGLLIAGAVIWNGQNPSTGSTGSPQVAKVDIKNVKTDGAPFIGQANARVTIAFWSDFQCPYCKAFEVGHEQIPTPAALPDIIKNYVDTGKVKIIFKDFIFLGNDSVTAGEYNRAIWKLYPNQYFAWRTAIYNAQDQEGDQGFGDAASIDKLNATISGIDATKVAADVKANGATYRAMMDADKAEAQKAGIGATPSFVIGTQLLQGAYPYANFETAINTALGK